ncbi:MAG: hypothetical protein JRC69_04425 [Deltaproteobacteria bacterium]|nr:hypothetical protein [Deltaproteobacteria bacterium]
MQSWLKKSVKIVIVAEIIYLLLVNAALNLPLTQTIVNGIKPDKFAVSWDRAWSLYPFNVHALGVSANGQSKSQQWQAKAPAATASISLAALLWRSVKLSGVEAEDVLYYQRPRPKRDKDYSDIRAYFPPIEGRVLETDAVALSPKKKSSKSWHISIDDIHAHGHHDIRLYQVQATLDGELRTDLTFRTKGGPFSLSNGEVDINLQSLILNGDHEVAQQGYIKGKIEFLPFVPKETKGLSILEFLNVDAELRTETESLAYLNIYLANFDGMKVDGSGLVQGRVHLQQGELLPGTDIDVSAPKLSLDMFDEHLEGDGTISIKVAENSDTADVLIAFTDLEAFDTKRDVLLFRGDGVRVEAQGDRLILSPPGESFKSKRLTLTIPEVEVVDLGVYQAYIPEKWKFTLHGGKGRLMGTAEITGTGFSSNLQLSSEAADVGLKEYRFTSNLDMALKSNCLTVASGVDVSGTYVHLQGVKLSSGTEQNSTPWHASVNIEQGNLKLLLPEGMAEDSSFTELYQVLKGQEIVTMLDSGNDEIKITGSISDLTWLNVFMKNRFDLALTGSGEVTVDLLVKQGLPAAGTKLAVHPQAFGVEVLDYSAEGNGEVAVLVEKGGEQPDVLLSVTLKDGEMRRKDEEEAFIENVSIKLNALARNITLDNKGTDMDLHLQIPSAMIRDMSVYNQYFPQDSPLQFTGGKAALSADIKLTPETADGYVRLRTNGLTAQVDQQEVVGELAADITLVDGVPENMDFDISGSSITLDNVRVVGEEVSIDDEEWSARFELKKARALWKKPIAMYLEADLQMTNSKPIVAVIANQRGKNGWLEKALTIDDVGGEAVINIAENHIIIPYAYAGSDKIDVGAKGVITADNRDGVLYVRFRKLHGILKINNGKRNLDVLNARKKFDQYDSDTVFSRFNIDTTY